MAKVFFKIDIESEPRRTGCRRLATRAGILRAREKQRSVCVVSDWEEP